MSWDIIRNSSSCTKIGVCWEASSCASGGANYDENQDIDKHLSWVVFWNGHWDSSWNATYTEMLIAKFMYIHKDNNIVALIELEI